MLLHWEERALQNPIKAFGRLISAYCKRHANSQLREDVEKEVARRTVMRVATRNIRLQRGQYVTKEDDRREMGDGEGITGSLMNDADFDPSAIQEKRP